MKSKILSFAILFLLIICTTATYAQQEYVWEKYKMGISVAPQSYSPHAFFA